MLRNDNVQIEFTAQNEKRERVRMWLPEVDPMVKQLLNNEKLDAKIVDRV